MQFTNEHNLHLSMAVFLAHDSYDYDSRPNAISTTRLLDATRQTVLSRRSQGNKSTIDISGFLASSLGTALHDGIEAAWSHGNHVRALQRLGYSQSMIDRIKVNPEPSELTADTIPIYLEQRREKEIDDFIVTGKFDFVGDGELVDHKSTSVYGYLQGNSEEKFRLQGSIYRWLNPDIITSDHMIVDYFFTDWSKKDAMIDNGKGYPPCRSLAKKLKLLTLAETETFIRKKLADIKTHLDVPEDRLPLCNKEDLWQKETVYKYYKNPANTTRSTKNYDTFHDAQLHYRKDGSIGLVKVVPGEVKKCRYCAGLEAGCSQAQALIAEGLLSLED